MKSEGSAKENAARYHGCGFVYDGLVRCVALTA